MCRQTACDVRIGQTKQQGLRRKGGTHRLYVRRDGLFPGQSACLSSPANVAHAAQSTQWAKSQPHFDLPAHAVRVPSNEPSRLRSFDRLLISEAVTTFTDR